MKIAVQNPYTSDNIGNRNSSTNNGVSTSYSANNLNQYTNINAEVPVYDLDGNMTEWNGWVFSWNGENRMVSATNSEHQVTFKYDYAGRCFEKVKDGVTNSFVWSGFNIVLEASNSHTNYNVWGKDLSGTVHGAGGVAGLLAVIQDGDVYLTAYDGNGNVCQYVDNLGDIVVQRAYSPFGITISLTGTKQDDFTHWWSTKPWDADTEMSEYEFRMYLPELGNWASRDLIGEQGGLSLYGFVRNMPIVIVDKLGLQAYTYVPTVGLVDNMTGDIVPGSEPGYAAYEQSLTYSSEQDGNGNFIAPDHPDMHYEDWYTERYPGVFSRVQDTFRNRMQSYVCNGSDPFNLTDPMDEEIYRIQILWYNVNSFGGDRAQNYLERDWILGTHSFFVSNLEVVFDEATCCAEWSVQMDLVDTLGIQPEEFYPNGENASSYWRGWYQIIGPFFPTRNVVIGTWTLSGKCCE